MAAPFVILSHDAVEGWIVEDEYDARTEALADFRRLVDNGINVAFIDIEEVQNP